MDNKENLKIEGKPFAGYANFDACVRANKNKRDPEAYCAEIMRTVEGKKAVEKKDPLELVR